MNKTSLFVLLLAALGSSLVGIIPAAAQIPNPIYADAGCGDGGGGLRWIYNHDGGVPDGAVRLDGGGQALPLQACMAETETDTNHAPCKDGIGWCPQAPLPVPPRPGCDPSVGGPGCPTGGPTPPPSTTPMQRPINPTGVSTLQLPAGTCSGGTGWDFEDGTWQGWQPGVIQPALLSVFVGNPDRHVAAAPVYGNNVNIARIKPPGYIASGPWSALDNIGGDYWEYSRDINQRGDYWVGSGDLRPDWTVAPGAQWSPGMTGTLTSPACQLNSNYLTFKIGGSTSWAQRVDLEVLPLPGENLRLTAQGLGNVETINMPPGPLGLDTTLDGTGGSVAWDIVRSSTNNDPNENDYMSRTVVWDVSQYVGHQVRIRIVDDTRNECASYDANNNCLTYKPEHINVDAFTFGNTPAVNTAWLPIYDQQCGSSSCGYWTQSFVGSADKPQPVWGTTDGHTHGTSNTSFGGHLFWGDISDSLPNVYNCSYPLPVIKDKLGNIVRDTEPTSHNGVSIESDCTLRWDVVALVVNELIADCQLLNLIPFIGVQSAGICDAGAVSAGVGLATQELFSGYSLHGATKMSSGTLRFGKWLADEVDFFAGALVSIRQMVYTPIQGAIPQADWDQVDGGHSVAGLGRTHQMYQYQMVQRAYQGGLRLIVMDAINSRAMELALDGRSDFDDWQAITNNIETMKRLTAGPGDPKYTQGALYGIAKIAYTPKQARDIIRAGQLAVILGTEVDELGKPRAWVANDSLQKQVDDLYAMGIRKITPTHAINNPIGATGEFQDIYQSQSFFDNAIQPKWDDYNFTEDGSAIPIAIAAQAMPFPFKGLPLGLWSIGQRLDHGATPNCTSAGPECWRGNSGGWLDIDTGNPSDWIGPYSQISFRYGYTSAAANLTPFYDHSSGLWNSSPIIHPYKMHDLGWLIGGKPLSNTQCDMTNMMFPLNEPIKELDSAMRNSKAHFNPLGLNPDGSGAQFLREMMHNGMILDVDHFSQHARVQVYDLTHAFAVEGGAAAPAQTGADYPLYGVHTGIRGFERNSPVPAELSNDYGYIIENDRSDAELKRVTANGGTIGMAATGSNMVPPTSPAQYGVANDCDFSSKTWATKYLYAMKLMQGRGLLPTTDMDGLTTPMASRYGWANPNHTACHQNWHAGNLNPQETMDNQLSDWRRDWDNAHISTCRYNSLGTWASYCPSTQMVQAQLKEFSGVYYTNYDSLGPVQPSWANGQFGLMAVKARNTTTFRDDMMPRAPIDEWVTYATGRQRRSMKQFGNWDFNLDGLAHIGLYPDFFQDVHNVGVTYEQLGPVFNAAEDFLQMWERGCNLATSWRSHNGQGSLACEN